MMELYQEKETNHRKLTLEGRKSLERATGKIYEILSGSLFLVFRFHSDSANPEPNEEGGAGSEKLPTLPHSVIPGSSHGSFL